MFVCLLLDAKNRFRLIVRAEEKKDSIQFQGQDGIGKKKEVTRQRLFLTIDFKGLALVLVCHKRTNEETDRWRPFQPTLGVRKDVKLKVRNKWVRFSWGWVDWRWDIMARNYPLELGTLAFGVAGMGDPNR